VPGLNFFGSRGQQGVTIGTRSDAEPGVAVYLDASDPTPELAGLDAVAVTREDLDEAAARHAAEDVPAEARRLLRRPRVEEDHLPRAHGAVVALERCEVARSIRLWRLESERGAMPEPRPPEGAIGCVG
jgi:hypothetical protein